mmetsp:Transcript_10168/g.13880  ORF Transcript_10168/g.13880 Transcript_10168/m.13880 type:complete len:133 (-) Transcript_10168:433-831(-)|eukprot:CAMPEP_0196572536 /NCGR_PEP_ID=MMETSP1081-20130531/2573_1 /TAXON_ID=36882 /ORGANISM="Pyramimonas amylifera, Strain CCMP720" /LENGTH=132 /DNA_ID=CAMNT_0041889895 /DNA_START=70 /DNA_END=468 /DNA_ORIENTATION=-
MSRISAVLLCVIGVLATSSLWVDASANVKVLDDSNYKESISDGKLYLIKFYAPWCGHCKRLAPTWDQLGDSLVGNDKVVIAKVDCTVAKDICTDAGVKGYPTLKTFKDGKAAKDYKGARELGPLKAFAEESA